MAQEEQLFGFNRIPRASSSESVYTHNARTATRQKVGFEVGMRALHEARRVDILLSPLDLARLTVRVKAFAGHEWMPGSGPRGRWFKSNGPDQ